MRKFMLGVMGAAFAFAMTAGVASASHNVPKDAKQVKGEFVKSYVACTLPGTATSNGFPACTPTAPGSPVCNFSTKGKGKYLAKYNALGVDKLPGTSDDGDVDLQATITGLGGFFCTGQVLWLTASVRATTDDCGGAGSCTVVDLQNFPLASCLIDSVGNCKIKSTVNTGLPGTLLPGKNVSIEVLDTSMFLNGQQLLRGGVLVK